MALCQQCHSLGFVFFDVVFDAAGVFLQGVAAAAGSGGGDLAGAMRLFSAPDTAIEVLNRYALYVAFPFLILQGFCRPELQLSSHVGFYVLHVALAGSLILAIVLLGWCAPSLRTARGNLVLGSLFGNVAYLGIPLCVLLLGGGFVWWGWISAKEWQVLLLLGFMPTAITTFSIAKDIKQNEGLMAQAIVLSTLLSFLLLPWLSSWIVS